MFLISLDFSSHHAVAVSTLRSDETNDILESNEPSFSNELDELKKNNELNRVNGLKKDTEKISKPPKRVKNTSHKQATGNKWLEWYYQSRIVLFTLCLLNEACWIGVYLEWNALVLVSAPFMIFKNVLNVIQLATSMSKLNRAEKQE